MQAIPNSQAWTTTILDDCHRLVLTHVHTLLEKMFDNSDTAFQEFINKAQSSASQIRFMEAMSIINGNRGHVEEVFSKHIATSFKEFSTLKYTGNLSVIQQNEPMALVSMEDTDIHVALQNMIASATMGSTQALYAIRQRLAVLNHGRKLVEEQIPAGPHSLADSFHKAIQELVLDHETRLIVYMLFDKFVLSRSATLYDEYNQRLLKAGLLPNLKYEVHKIPVKGGRSAGNKSPGGDAATAANQEDQAGGMTLGDELFSSILQLLSRRDRSQTEVTGSAISTEPLPQANVVSAIHQLQLKRYSDKPGVSDSTTLTGAQLDRQVIQNMVAQLSEEREQLFSGLDRRRLPSADTQVIDLVGMMFEYLLNDPDLPSVAKAELCRLHTPYLKVAIIDKALFTNARHPAHELLNLLANAGTKWVFENDLSRGIFPVMRKIIQRIIEEFDSDIDLFGELLELCRNTVLELENKSTAIEQRTRQAAAGRDKLDLARACSADAIESRLNGHNIPVELRRMFNDTWIDKLMFIYLREPESEYSTTWNLAIQTIESIIWSVEPRFTSETLEQLREKLPNLRRKIQRAFEMLDAYGASDNEAQLSLIFRLQDQAAAEFGEQPVTPLPTEHSPPEVTAASGPAPSDETFTTTPVNDAPDGTHASEAPSTTVKADNPAPEPRDKCNDGRPESPRHPPAVNAALARMDDLSFGTWFSFQDSDDAMQLRLKLSWFSQMSGNYMFVDSMGIKAAVMSRIDLATRIANGKARILAGDRKSFVTRAMESVRRVLNSNQSAMAGVTAGRMPG